MGPAGFCFGGMGGFKSRGLTAGYGGGHGVSVPVNGLRVTDDCAETDLGFKESVEASHGVGFAERSTTTACFLPARRNEHTIGAFMKKAWFLFTRGAELGRKIKARSEMFFTFGAGNG